MESRPSEPTKLDPPAPIDPVPTIVAVPDPPQLAPPLPPAGRIPAPIPAPIANPKSEIRNPQSCRRRIAVAIATVLLLLIWLPLRTPVWYAPPVIAEPDRQAVRDDLTRMGDRFSEALLAAPTFAVELTQRQLNDWLAMRADIWPAAGRAIPPPWREPFVALRAGQVLLATRCDALPGAPVVSLAIDVRLDNDEIVLRPAGGRCGSMPLPLGWLSRWMKEAEIDYADRGTGVTARGRLDAEVRVNTRHTWWNGRRDYHIRSVQLSEGLLRLEIEPLGPRSRRP